MNFDNFAATNNFLAGLTRRVEIALEECCLKLESTNLGCLPGWFFIDFKCSDGILLQACMPDDEEWDGSIAIIKGNALIAQPYLPQLIDVLMAVKSGDILDENPPFHT